MGQVGRLCVSVASRKAQGQGYGCPETLCCLTSLLALHIQTMSGLSSGRDEINDRLVLPIEKAESISAERLYRCIV